MKVAVGTLNKAKNAAVATVFAEAFPDEIIEIVSHEVESGISKMPIGDDEILMGAMNRAFEVRELVVDADYAVGLEGGAHYGPKNRLYLLGWAAIMKGFDNKDGLVGKGFSAGVEIPLDISDAIFDGEELGPLMQARTGDTDNKIRHTLGTNGLLTDGLYPRDREFEDAIRTALAPFKAPHFYKIK